MADTASTQRLRLIYLGSGEFGLPTLQALTQQHDVIAVVSQPDRVAGRGQKITPTPISQWVNENLPDVPLLKFEDVNTPEAVAEIAKFEADAGVVIAFGQKLSPELIGSLGKLAVNLHASLLPKYRGAAPIHWAIINGETHTGVSVIGLAQRMDAGAVYQQIETPIGDRETTGELHDRLATLGPEAVLTVINDLINDTLMPIEQDEAQTCRAPKLNKKRDGTVDFNQPAHLVRAHIHGLNPWPGCTIQWQSQHHGDTQTLILRRVAVLDSIPHFIQARLDANDIPKPGEVCEQFLIATPPEASPPPPPALGKPISESPEENAPSIGLIRLLEVQSPGSTITKADSFAAGNHLMVGDQFLPTTAE